MMCFSTFPMLTDYDSRGRGVAMLQRLCGDTRARDLVWWSGVETWNAEIPEWMRWYGGRIDGTSACVSG